MPSTFALLSPCGTGNLGDAAIQDAMIANIRSRIPDARILGITLNPRDTEQRHGIRSFPIVAEVEGQRTEDREQRSEDRGQRTENGLLPSVFCLLSSVLCLLSSVLRPLCSVIPESIRRHLRVLRKEGRHVVEAYRWLRSVDTLIVSGGGQLDEFWGGPWGHPWALFKWALLARLRNARVLFLSVGFGSLDSRWGRVLARLALALADYRSYRDTGSRELMRRAGFARTDPIVPDLAYSLPTVPERGPLAGSIRTVGISPIAFCSPRAWPVRDARRYESYLERLVQVAAWLVQTNHRLVFFASGGPDHRVAEEAIARLSSRISPGQRRQIVQARVVTVDGFLKQAAALDVVVASRLHGLLLSHLAGTPTIAISYDRKVDVLMTAMAQEAYALNIDAFRLGDFQSRFAALGSSWSTVQDQLRAKRREYRVLLQRQFDRVLQPPVNKTKINAEEQETAPCPRHALLLSA